MYWYIREVAMLYVEKDLSGVAKAIFDQWDLKKEELNHKVLYCADARVSPDDVIACIEQGIIVTVPWKYWCIADENTYAVSGKKCTFKCLPTTGVPDRDIMYQLYNEMGMYGGKELPDENVIALGVKMHGIEDFVRERLLPHLCLN